MTSSEKGIWPSHLTAHLAKSCELSNTEIAAGLTLLEKFCAIPPPHKQFRLPLICSKFIQMTEWLELIDQNLITNEHRLAKCVALKLSTLSIDDLRSATPNQCLDEESLKVHYQHQFTDTPNKNPLVPGGASKYPIYTMLLASCENPHLEKRLTQLQALLCHFTLNSEIRRIDNKRLYSAAMLLRAAAKPNRPVFLESLSPLEMYNSATYKPKLPPRIRTPKKFSEFISYLRGKHQYKSRELGSRRARADIDSAYTIHDYTHADDNEDGEDDESNQKAFGFVEILDNLGGEFEPEAEIIVIDEDEIRPKFSSSPPRTIEAVNQPLGNFEQACSPSEIALVLAAIDKLIAADNHLLKDTFEAKQVGLLIRMQVFLGASYKSARSAFNTSEQVNNDANLTTIVKSDLAYWKRKVKLEVLEEERNGTSLKIQRHLLLPDITGIQSLYMELNSESQNRDRVQALAGMTQELYRHFLKDLSRYIASIFHQNISISESRLRKSLPEIMHRSGEDPINIRYIFNHIGFPTRTQCFYQNIESKELEKLYVNSIRAMATEINDEGYNLKISSISFPSINKGYIGHGGVDDIKDIRESLDKIRNAIRNKRNSYIERANLYSCYTAIVIAFTSGHRETINPTPLESWLNIPGFVLLSDKDGLASGQPPKSFFNTRLVPIQPKLSKQLENWRYLQAEILESAGSLGFQLDQNISASEISLLYIDNKNRTIKYLSPSHIRQTLSPFYDHPIKSARYFLRSELSKRNCYYENIDAFMSHWARGQEPWGDCSSFDYSRFRHEVSEAIEGIVKDIQIKTINPNGVIGDMINARK